MRPGRRILVVDDEPDIRDSLKMFIERQFPGALVTTAATGAEGLRELSEARPHLIITDFKMPDMNGVEFLQAARAHAPGTPCIMMTAYPDIDVTTRAINDAHVESFLIKPFEPDVLVERIGRIFQVMENKFEKERELARTLRGMQQALENARK